MEGSGIGSFRGQIQPVLLAGAFASTGPHSIPEVGFKEYRY